MNIGMSNGFGRRLRAVAIVTAVCTGLPMAGHAQRSASSTIRLVVPFGPGGAGDMTARVVAQKMSESLGATIVVDNKPGAGGVVASDAVAKAKPDGKTLLLLTNGAAVTAALFKTLPFDTLKDFAPVSTLGYFDMVVVVAAGSPFKTLPEFLTYARAHPGKVNLGSISVGSSQNLAAEMFKSSAVINVQVVPFNGTPALVTALRGGHIDAAVEILAPMVTQIQANEIRALGVMGDKRTSALHDVPTVAEGGVPNFSVSAWNGLAAPARTPAAQVQKLYESAQAALAAPDVRKQLADLYVEARSCTPEQMSALMQSEIRRWNQVIDRAGIPRQ